MVVETLFVIALAAHGIGHVIGLFTHLEIGGMSVKSSLLNSLGITQGLIKLLSYIWIIPFITFIASAWAMWTGASWWAVTGWIGTLVSVAYFILYWNSFPSNIPIQANIGNVVALAGLLGIITIS